MQKLYLLWPINHRAGLQANKVTGDEEVAGRYLISALCSHTKRSETESKSLVFTQRFGDWQQDVEKTSILY